ncbi:hypothetical protein SASPL_129052 [Salvia splendens]|uniref:Uncharacterized protein n=1 Tax=Salvia splendens TaxID=180675 RepID=A0A8X8XEC1_SALSN|nr:hypothetical protein SASPL_129052 [Salvia splendens]
MRPPRGRGGGGFRGGRDGGGRGFRGGGGGRFGPRDEGPPSEVIEVSTFVNACEGDAVTKLSQEKIPYFNLPREQDADWQRDKGNLLEGQRKILEDVMALHASPISQQAWHGLLFCYGV